MFRNFWGLDRFPMGLDWFNSYIETLRVKLPINKEDLYNLNFKNRILNLKKRGKIMEK